jgi:methyl-accepting chemotaxis protein
MKQYSPSEVAEMLRKQADELVPQAKADAASLRHAADEIEKIQGPVTWLTEIAPRASRSAGNHAANGTITVDQLENRIRRKSARIGALAQEFHVSEQAITALLEPHSRVYHSTRGWLRLRETQ